MPTRYPEPEELSISEILLEVQNRANAKELEAYLEGLAVKEDHYVIAKDCAILAIQEKRFYLDLNFSSIYRMCESLKSGEFAMSRSTAQGCLERARVYRKITSYEYVHLANAYLAQLEPSRGMGSFDEFGVLRGFKPSDFAGHREKLSLVHQLILHDSTKLDWKVFFESSFDDYEALVKALLPAKERKPEVSGPAANPEVFSSAEAFYQQWEAQQNPASEVEQLRLDFEEDCFRPKSVSEHLRGLPVPCRDPKDMPPWDLDRVPTGVLILPKKPTQVSANPN